MIANHTEATNIGNFVLHISSQESSNSNLFDTTTPGSEAVGNGLYLEQRKELKLKAILTYLKEEALPQDEKEAK